MMDAQSQGTWVLTITGGPLSGRTYPIEQSDLIIGRDPTSDIPIDLPSISRQHARLTYVDGWFSIQDMGSSNGVTVNGVRISAPQLVQPGDQIMLSSDVVFSLQWPPMASQGGEQTMRMGQASAGASTQNMSPVGQYGAPTPQYSAPAPQYSAPAAQYGGGLAQPPPKPASSKLVRALPFVGCALVLLCLGAAGIVAALIMTDTVPNPFAGPTPTYTLVTKDLPPTNTATPVPTWTSVPTWTPVAPSPTPGPTDTTVPAETPTETATTAPTETTAPTATTAPPTNTAVPPTNTPTLPPPPPPTHTPTSVSVPTSTATPTATATKVVPLTLDWTLDEARCISKSQWIAKFTLTASGGSGQYIYYRDIDQLHGPTNNTSYVYELKYGMSAAVGTFRVRSGSEEAESKFYVPHPDCSTF